MAVPTRKKRLSRAAMKMVDSTIFECRESRKPTSWADRQPAGSDAGFMPRGWVSPAEMVRAARADGRSDQHNS